MDVFISYSVKDQSSAESLRCAFRSKDVKCFSTPVNINPGARWPDALRKELESCLEVYVLVSQDALESAWVRMEMGAAWALNKPITPVLLRDSTQPLPPPLQDLQCGRIDQIDRLVADFIERHPARLRPSSPSPDKALVFDVDGTLLKDRESLHDRRAVLEYLTDIVSDGF